MNTIANTFSKLRWQKANDINREFDKAREDIKKRRYERESERLKQSLVSLYSSK